LVWALKGAAISEERSPAVRVRRVVTGHTEDGRSVVADDAEVEAITIRLAPGMEFHRLWGEDAVPTLPCKGVVPALGDYFPGPGGFRFGLFTVPPDAEVGMENVDVDTALAECEEKLPGVLKFMEPENPGMHTTDTVDFEYVVSGEVWLELDDGHEVHLQPGDSVIQNGTRHAWRNHGGEPCQMVTCLIGAQRK